MDNTVKIKEALKFAMAFAIVYGIALKLNWISPGWAGWSVVAISATSGGGESLQKGLLRIWGTLLACIVGISIISLGAQNRWLFMILTAGWMFFCTYKMLADKEKSYFWFVAGYVALVITAAGPSSVGGFYIAVYRTIETILGIIVYTLISVFVWPRTNIGVIKKSVSELLHTQADLFGEIKATFGGMAHIDKIKELSQTQVKQLDQFRISLRSEGSESYQVKELKPLWKQFESLNDNMSRSIDRLIGGVNDLSNSNNLFSPKDIDHFFNEMNRRCVGMIDLFSGKSSSLDLQKVEILLSSVERTDLSHFDKAALAIIIAEFNSINAISQEMVSIAIDLTSTDTEYTRAIIKDLKSTPKSRFNLPVIDFEYLKGAFYVGSTVIVGFIIWFFVNPPGHSSWYIYGGVFALVFSGAQQVKTIKLIIPFIVIMFFTSFIYLFILPAITSFYQLGILLFTCMFLIQYFLPSAAATIFTIVFIQLIAINNPQSYNISGLINSFFFVIMLMVYLFGMSYLINSPRPEKAFLTLVNRFFRSTKYLVSLQSTDTKSMSFINRYKTSFYLYELHRLPDTIKGWGKAIDNKLFPHTDHEEIEHMIDKMKLLVARMDTLLLANNNNQESLPDDLNEILNTFRQGLAEAFDNWDNLHKNLGSDSNQLLLEKIEEKETTLKNMASENTKELSEGMSIEFYQLLGGLRGVTAATLSFVGVANKLDWHLWQEERFQ